MAAQAPIYDLMLLLSTAAPEEQRTKILADVESAITNADGSIERKDDWGQRPLAYRIQHQPDADYHLLQFKAPPTLIETLSHDLRDQEPPRDAGGAGFTAARGCDGRPGRLRRRVGNGRLKPSVRRARRGAPPVPGAWMRPVFNGTATVHDGSIAPLQLVRPFSGEHRCCRLKHA